MAQTDLLHVILLPRYVEFARLAQAAVIAAPMILAGCAETKPPQFCKSDYTARYEDSRSWIEYRNADHSLPSGPLRPDTEDDRQYLTSTFGIFTDDGYFQVPDVGLIVPSDISSRERWKKDHFTCERSDAGNSLNVTCRSDNRSITTTYTFDPAVGITSFKMNCSGCANSYAKLVTKQGMGALCSDDILRLVTT